MSKISYIYNAQTYNTQRMKRFFYLIALSAILVSGCKKPDSGETPGNAPQIELGTQNNLVVEAEGGTVNLAYEIVNPVDGGQISAESKETWMHDFNYDTENTIVFSVDPNEGTEPRSSVLTVVYAYGEGLSVSVDLNVIQNGAVAYDYEWEMSEFTSTWYGDMYGINGEHNYYTWLSDMPFVDGSTQTGGTYYLFDIYAPAPEDESAPQIPAGTYTLGELEATAEWTFSPDYSKAIRYNDSGLEWSADFADGTLTVSYDGGTMTMEAFLTDNEGKLHHLTYTGEGICIDDSAGGSGGSGFGEDVDFNASLGIAAYAADNGTLMEVIFQFTDMELDGEGYVIPPGTLLAVDALMPLDDEGNIATGTYTVSDSQTEFTLFPGEDYYGYMYFGTYAQNIVSNEESYVSLVTGGTMEITGGDGNYTITCDLIGSDGYKISCSWSGEMTVSGMPGPISTLTGDYTLDLEGATASGICWGDYYGTGGNNWTLQIMPSGGPDGFITDFVSGTGDFSAGIPSGTYKVSANGTPVPGEYLQGYMSGSDLGGTMYVGGFTAEGYVTSYAPATSGDMIITNNGDGTYNLEFAFVDDLGNTWDGEWTGAISLEDQSSAPSASPSGHMLMSTPAARIAGESKARIFENIMLRSGNSSVPVTSCPSGRTAR